MLSLKGAILLVVISISAYFFFKDDLPLHIEGTADKRFERVKAAFVQNFKDKWEHDGASIVVYYKGKKVVDLWGGYADRDCDRKWEEDTMMILFSSSKSFGSLSIALLVDRGLLSYDDLVTKHWPQFGQNGKENVTVGMLLSHQAGLAYFDEDVNVHQAADHKEISRRFEKQRPNWPPGTMSAYHALTHGWLVDQLIRRVDPAKRSIGQFVREEFHEKYGIDAYMGLPKEEAMRVARVYDTNKLDCTFELLTDFSKLKTALKFLPFLTENSPMGQAFHNVPWMRVVGKLTVNNPQLWRLEQAGALGISNARGLAQLYDLVVRKQLISEATLSQLTQQRARMDFGSEDLSMPVATGLFMQKVDRAGTKYAYGHPGYGCQQGMMDLGNELAVGYTTNGMKMLIKDSCTTWDRLISAIYDVIENKT